MIYKYFVKKSATHKETVINFENQQLVEELTITVIGKFETCKVYSFLKNIWSAGLADMELINKFNIRIQFF